MPKSALKHVTISSEEYKSLLNSVSVLKEKNKQAYQINDSLKKEYAKICQENADLHETFDELKISFEKLTDEADQLRKALFGRKSEKSKFITVGHGQLTLFDIGKPDSTIELENVPSTTEPVIEKPFKEKKKRGRRRVAVNLPVREEIIEVPEEGRVDENGEQLSLLGYETSERLNYIPGKIEKLITKRQVWGTKDSREQVNIAEVPDSIVQKGKLTDSFIHNMVYEKFYNSMPLHRQMKSYNALGADLSKSTMSEAVKFFAVLYSTIALAIRHQIFSGFFVHSDETPMKYGQFKDKYKQGYVFVYQNREQAYFHYGISRSQKEIKGILGHDIGDDNGYIGYLMCDGYAGYNVHMGIRMACWAHVRRQFFKISQKNRNAMDILKAINILYRIEREVSELAERENFTEEQMLELRLKRRKEESAEIIKEIKGKLDLYEKYCTPESSMGKAITYAKKRWEALQVYLEHGALPIDNNAAERSLRKVVVGRKNYMFVGSEAGGQWAAICYTIMESCRLQGIDPRKYLEIVTPKLLELGNDPEAPYHMFTPVAMKDYIKNLPKDPPET